MPTPFDLTHYRSLFDNIDHGFCTIEVIFDEQGRGIDYRFLDVNRAFEEQTGMRGVIGRTMRELVPAHEEPWFRQYGNVARTREPVRFEQAAAGLGRHFECYAFPVGDPALNQVAVLFSEISARKRAQRDLRASEARYRALVQATTNSLYRISADGCRLLNVHGGRVAPRATTNDSDACWLDGYIHDEDLPQARAAWDVALAHGAAFDLEHRTRFVDGSVGWVHTRVVPVRNDDGEIVEWIGSGSDITRRREASEALRKSEADHLNARRDAERANRTKDEFVAMLGHELRNPLSPMLTALQLMRMRGLATREQDILERQVRHLMRMVDDLLDVSRVSRGKVELQRKPIELHGIITRAIEMAGPMLEQRQNRVDVRVPRRGAGIDVDWDRMAQVFSNLLTNASKYSPTGSRIWILGERLGDVVRLAVQDEGSGIAPEMLERVFDAFVQETQSIERAAGGLGLGLAIVRSLVEAHGGHVRAESLGPGKGAAFIVELPAAYVRQAPLARVSPTPARQTPGAPHDTVLVVDDNEDAATMMQAALEQLGYRVEVAFDGPSALAKADDRKPAVVLLDIGLPVMDGYEVARRLREMSKGRPVRLIAVTGYGQETDRRRALDAGFEHHLVKPVDLERLEQLLSAAR